MLLRMGLRPLLVCCVLFAAGQTAPAQVKVAVINLRDAVFKSAEIAKANDQMQATFKPKQDEIDQLNREIANIADQLQKGAGKLTPQAEADLNAQGSKKQRDLQRKTEDLQAETDAYRNDVLSKSTQKMQDVVKKLAEEKALDLVVDVSTTVYFKPALDITKDAIAAYDKAYPAK